MSWIQLTQNQTVVETEEGPMYEIRFNVLSSYAIEPELFVVSTSDDKYSHVATVRDLKGIPRDKADAIDQGLGYYRVAKVILRAYTKPAASEATEIAQRRLQLVVKDWANDEGITFGGTETFVYSSGAQ